MNKLKYFSTLATALLLSACGSGSGDCESTVAGGCAAPGDDPTAATVSTVVLITSGTQLTSAGNEPVELTAIVSDENSGAVSGANVQFSASGDSGARLSSSIVATDSAGLARVTLNTIDPENRGITMTAAVSSIVSEAATINVTGTEIAVSGSESIIIGGNAKYTLSLTDSDGAALANKSVSLTSANGNEIVDEDAAAIDEGTLVTDSEGELIFQVNANVTGGDRITALSLGAEFVKVIDVSDDSFTFVSPAPGQEIPLGAVVNVTARWIENNTPKNGETLYFFSARGDIAPTAVTDANGEATVTISSDDSGLSELTVNDGAGKSTTIQIEFVADNADFMTLQPELVNVVTDGSTKIKATVYSGANLVKNKTVVFSVNDPTGGTISPLTAVTNTNGEATTTYRAGPTPSGTGAVTINAYVLGTASVNADTPLTVAGQEFRFDIGTGNEIEELSQTLYGKEWSIIVTDGNSNAVGNSQIQVSAPPQFYSKGYYEKGAQSWIQVVTATCISEDRNRSGRLEIIEDPLDPDFGLSEDTNGNGQLDPSNVVSVVPIDPLAPLDSGCENAVPTGSSKTFVETNAGGIARICLIYNQDKATWAQIDMTATAGVSGTESSENVQWILDGAASDYSNLDVNPPGNPSPYGVAVDCADPL